MRRTGDIETAIRAAAAEEWDVQHGTSLACTIRLVTARVLLVLAGTSGLWALWLILGGGINLRIAGRIITSNDPVRPLALAALAFTAYAWIAGVHSIQQRLSRAFDRIGDARLAIADRRSGPTLLGIVYAATAGVASDGYGYVSGADLWIRRNLLHSGAADRGRAVASARNGRSRRSATGPYLLDGRVGVSCRSIRRGSR